MRASVLTRALANQACRQGDRAAECVSAEIARRHGLRDGRYSKTMEELAKEAVLVIDERGCPSTSQMAGAFCWISSRIASVGLGSDHRLATAIAVV